MNVEVKLTGVSIVCMAGSLTGSVRANFSISHLLAAASFSRAVGTVENENKERPFGEFFEDIQSNAIATVLTATAALESYANELFVDHATVFPNMPAPIMAKLWELYEMKQTLEKFEFALLLLRKERFNQGISPYQDVVSLIKLRNALVHFKPEWTDQQIVHARVSSSLKDRVDRSPFFVSGEPLFPRAWASHSTTKWAVISVLSFISAFEKLANLQPRLQLYMHKLV